MANTNAIPIGDEDPYAAEEQKLANELAGKGVSVSSIATAPVPPYEAYEADYNSGSGEKLAVPTADIKYSAADLDALAAANGVDAGEGGNISDSFLFENENRAQAAVQVGAAQARNQETNTSLSQQPPPVITPFI